MKHNASSSMAVMSRWYTVESKRPRLSEVNRRFVTFDNGKCRKIRVRLQSTRAQAFSKRDSRSHLLTRFVRNLERQIGHCVMDELLP